MIKNSELINKVVEAIIDHDKEITRLDIQTKGGNTHIFLYTGEKGTGFSSEYVDHSDTVAENFVNPSIDALYPGE